MTNLDIDEHNEQQEGIIEFKKFGDLDIDLHVQTIPKKKGLEDVILKMPAHEIESGK